MAEDEEICDEDMLSDQEVLNREADDRDEDEGSLLDECGRFSENDAIESSEGSRPVNTEEADENFEDLIDQEEEQKASGKQGKARARAASSSKIQLDSHKNSGRANALIGSAGTGSQSDFVYQLVGVLVHSGSANSGHYYSYIKERGVDNPRWLEFNDRIVREFNFADLAKECFGTPPDKN